MEEKKYNGNRKNSLNISVNEVNSTENQLNSVRINGKEGLPQREVYKKLSEDNFLPAIPKEDKKSVSVSEKEIALTELNSHKNSKENLEKDGKMVQEQNGVSDGADEHMLDLENKTLNEKRDEVKFINGDHLNGDAKIDIGSVNAKDDECLVFTGMTKEELMKYANDPFWVRLRWIFFIGFWAIWVGMLVGAILIIMDAPKCAAPDPLPWFKSGILGKSAGNQVDANDVAAAQKMHARGVIYELPPESTYAVHEPQVEQEIKDMVAKYKDTDIEVILDITPNYVNANSTWMKEAMTDKSKRSMFIWQEQLTKPNNWLALTGGSAWQGVMTENWVLSQFGKGLYDLRMSDPLVKAKLTDALQHLIKLGVKGFRLKNAKFFLLGDVKLADEQISTQGTPVDMDNYAFTTHTYTTFLDGLNDYLYDLRSAVRSASPDVFLSVAEDIDRKQYYLLKNDPQVYVDLPIYGRLTKFLGSVEDSAKLLTELNNTMSDIGKDSWLQFEFDASNFSSPELSSSYTLFMSLIRGTPIIPLKSTFVSDMEEPTFKHIIQMRESPSFMHGNFSMYYEEGLVAYSRIKAGNPGYLVVFNPYHVEKSADFSMYSNLPTKLTVDRFSANYNIPNVALKNKVSIKDIKLSPRSTIIYTYVPVRSD